MKKTAKEWANEYLNSEEGKIESARISQEARDYVLFGKPTRYLNEKFLEEMVDYTRIRERPIESLISKFNLNQKEIEDLIIMKNLHS